MRARVLATVGMLVLASGGGRAADLVWTGVNGITWDLATTVNWLNGAVPSLFNDADTVLFGDTSSTQVVALVGTLAPSAVTNDSALNYTLQGAGKITGATGLTKAGAGILTISAGNNDYTGDTTIKGGVLKLGVAAAIPQTSRVVVESGAAFDFGGIAPGARTNTFVIAGDGGGNGAIQDSAGNGGISGNSSIYRLFLAGDAAVGTAGRYDVGLGGTAGSLLDGGGFTLTKVGTGMVNIRAQLFSNVYSVAINQGTLRYENYDRNDAVTAVTTNIVAAGAVLDVYGTRTLNMPLVFNGGALKNSNGAQTWNGPMVLNANSTMDTTSGNITYSGTVSGVAGLAKMSGNSLVLAADNTYQGGTVISNGVLVLGNGGASGSVPGAITLAGGSVSFFRSDAITLTNPIVSSGSGSLIVRTPAGLTIDGTVGLSNIGGISVGNGSYGRLDIVPGASIDTINFFLGDTASISGTVYQTGGDVNVRGQFRVGHYSTETSEYYMSGGTLTIADNTGPNPSGTAEANGALYLGIDGTGVFTQSGGVVRATGMVLDNRGDTAGTDTYTLLGGTLEIGRWGIQRRNGTTLVSLGGATVRAWEHWVSPSAMTLSGQNGSVNIDPAGYTVALNGALSGAGGLNLVGPGTLTLGGANSYLGPTEVSNGTLRVTGSLLSSGTVGVAAGATLAGAGSVGQVTVQGGGYVAPGNSTGTLTVSNLVLNNGAGLRFELAAAATVGGGTNDLINDLGDLSIGTGVGVDIALLGTSLDTTASYRLIDYASNLVAGGAANLSVVGPMAQSRYGFTFDDATANQINLTVTGANADLLWTGASSGAWNVQTTTNWHNINTATPDTYYQADRLVFDDSSTVTNVTLAGDMHPASLAVHGAVGYTLHGGGLTMGNSPTIIISDANGSLDIKSQFTAGSNLTKEGPGTLKLTGATLNTLASGGVYVRDGTLVFGAAGQTNLVGGEMWVGYGGGPGANAVIGGGTNFVGSWVAIARDVGTGDSSLSITGGSLRVANLSSSYQPNGLGGKSYLTISGDGYLEDYGFANIAETTGTWSQIAIRDNGVFRIVGNSGSQDFRLGMGNDSTAFLELTNNGALYTGRDMIQSGGARAHSRIDVHGGLISQTSGWWYLGNGANSVGELHVHPGGVVRSSNNLRLGGGNDSTGVVEIAGGTLTNLGALIVGDGTRSFGRFVMSGGFVTNSGTVYLGEAIPSVGVMEISDGTMNVAGEFRLGAATNASGFVNVTGGSLTGGSWMQLARIGTNSYGEMNISGDTVLQTYNRLNVGEEGTGILRVYGSGSLYVTNENGGTSLLVAQGAGATGSVYLGAGGLIATREISASTGGARSSQIDLDGGTLRALIDRGDFMQGFMRANVSTNGAIFDSQQFNITVGQQLRHDPALGAQPDGGLAKQGTGTLTLTGSNTYSGTTRVMAGTLALGGSGSIHHSTTLQIDAGARMAVTGLAATMHLKGGQTLKGEGTFQGPMIADSTSTVAPGIDAPGILNVDGNWQMDAGSAFDVQLNGLTAGLGYDQLLFANNGLTLNNPTLNLALGFAPGVGNVFTIVSGLGAPAAGTFAGLPDGTIVTNNFAGTDYYMEVSYDGSPVAGGPNNDVTLTVVPEPAVFGLVGFGMALLLARRRRR